MVFIKRKGSISAPQSSLSFPFPGNNMYNYFLFQGSFAFTQVQSGAPIKAPATKTVMV